MAIVEMVIGSPLPKIGSVDNSWYGAYPKAVKDVVNSLPKEKDTTKESLSIFGYLHENAELIGEAIREKFNEIDKMADPSSFEENYQKKNTYLNSELLGVMEPKLLKRGLWEGNAGNENNVKAVSIFNGDVIYDDFYSPVEKVNPNVKYTIHNNQSNKQIVVIIREVQSVNEKAKSESKFEIVVQ